MLSDCVCILHSDSYEGMSISKKNEAMALVRSELLKLSISDIVKKYGGSEKNTGSTEVQCALLTKRIEELMIHLSKYKKDLHSRRGLINLVEQRRSLLKYLKRNNLNGYTSLIAQLGLRK
jgi:small subunit ribosomal protein S15